MDLLSIGRFARLAGLTVRAVRHYGELGLLDPAYVDEDSGYRYFTPKQLADAEAIKRLRSLQLPLHELKRIIPAHYDELFAYLAELGEKDAGPPVTVCPFADEAGLVAIEDSVP